MLATRGATVLIAARRKELGEQAATELSQAGDIRFVKADVAKAANAAFLVEAVIAWGNRLDIVVNSAGPEATGPLVHASEKKWERLQSLDPEGVWPVWTLRLHSR